MYNLNNELKEKISNLNDALEYKYNHYLDLNKNDFRAFIRQYIGSIIPMEKLDKDILSIYEGKGGIVGVDGSNNRVGGAYPHYIEIYQALAKSTVYTDNPIFNSDVYCPLYPENGENPLEDEKIIEDKRNTLLATLEVKAAIEAVSKHKPYAILMDGGLIRYNIYAYDMWMELKTRCEEEGIILIGVIKDIKTSIIGDVMQEQNPDIKDIFYDRELLFGVLDYGEMILIDDEVNRKKKEGYSSVFLRSSLAPSVIGMDIIDTQKEYIEEMARLVFTLTPENSRGVPLWLDIVDKEVKISDDMMRALLERYLDRGVYERFFVSERDKRT
ncbi:DNA double-strand break repair nuclease NurA [Paratissierella segnis]|jgi:hypothetical protein|uniref:DNA double-strand break repair nuclease NurA n=1 Tax=Paratissierella segnis TaxID=2763679 RepID=A0A926EPF4_9FIRM|nr:DNA double-strand break repair nuclease NurA [Paratissierella segnis]MBC8587283.1 DNA double-strand break repair nuclease NurA [Paratissierella segnis]